MLNVALKNIAGQTIGEVQLSESVFGIAPNPAVLHTYVKAYLANQRQGTQSALTRAEVSGGGKKPWRQKGTGRARQGSTRSPQWTHGGIVFAPKPRDYRIDLPKKMKRAALRSALSDKVQNNSLIVIDSISFEDYKTKAAKAMLDAVKAGRSALVVLADNDQKAVRSFANIPGVMTAQTNTISSYDVLNHETLIIARGAVEKIEEVYA